MNREQYQLHAEVESRHWWFVARRRIATALVRELLPPSPESLILDVGCGTGGNLASLAREYPCVGADPSPEAIALARHHNPDVEFVCGTPQDELASLLPHVRLVTVMDVLEHVADDFSLLADLVSLTSPGTYFLLTVPAGMELWSQHDVSFGHYRRYDEERFRRIWRDLPVDERLVSHLNSRLYPLIHLLRSRNRRRRQTWGDHGTDLHVPPPLVNRFLEWLFAGERKRLIDVLRGKRSRGFDTGVSLIAILRRTEGEPLSFTRPDDVPEDVHQPLIHAG